MRACPQCGSPIEATVRFCGQCGAAVRVTHAAGDPPAEIGEADPWIGRVLDRRYRVLSRIGSGGMGVVYRVEHVQLGKVAAMKVLHAEAARNRDAVRRFHLEARAVSRLNHPNIVQTFDFGHSEGALYLVMEFLRGEDLATILKREGAMEFARAAPLVVQVCSALAEAHEAGVIHRDLKPENIVVVRRREGTELAKVLDFGLAKLRERSGSAEITSGGQVMGTPYYMSPEQVRSEPLDGRTDIYSLGATLYRMLTGTPPFDAPTPMAILSKHLTDEVEPLSQRAPELGLPSEVDEIVARAMAKSPQDRYESVTEMQGALERALASAGFGGTRAAAQSAPQPVSAVPPGEQRAATGARTVTVEDTDSENRGGQRLRRSDFDAFERSLKRRRVARMTLFPAFVLVVIASGIWLARRGAGRGSAAEREPNNSAGYATVIAGDQRVSGQVGGRLPGGQPDLDYFRLSVGGGNRVLSARLEGIAGVDLVLELYDAQGRSLGKCDDGGLGRGEWLQPTKVDTSEAYLLVRPVWVQGELPIENAAGEYHLIAHLGGEERGSEVEPNDAPELATVLVVGQGIRGFLPGDDRDWFRVVPPRAGRLTARVTPPRGNDVVIEIEGQAGSRRVVRSKADALDVKAEAGVPMSFALARRAPGKGDRKQSPATGYDEPYTIAVQLRPLGQ